MTQVSRLLFPLGFACLALPLVAHSATGVTDPLRGFPRLQLSALDAPVAAIRPAQGRYVIVDRGPSHVPDASEDQVLVLDAAGAVAFRRSPGLDVAGATMLNILDATLQDPDTLVVSANTGSSNDQDAQVLIQYDLATGKAKRIVRTTPLLCENLHTDRLGILWCYGVNVTKHNLGTQDYDLVYRFNPDLVLAGSSLPAREFPVDPLSASRRGFLSFLQGGKRTTLWLPANNRLIEFEDDGSVHRMFDLPTQPHVDTEKESPVRISMAIAGNTGPVAILPVATPGNDARDWRRGLFHLSGNGTSWTPLGIPGDSLPLSVRMVGVDSRGLVLVDVRDQAIVWLPWASVGTTEAAKP